MYGFFFAVGWMPDTDLLCSCDSSPKERRVQRDQCSVEWTSFKGDMADLSQLQPPDLPLHPTLPRGTTSGGPCSFLTSPQHRTAAVPRLTMPPPFLRPFWLKHRVAAQVNYRPAPKITGCNSLAWVERMTDLGIAELPCEPGKPWIALWSLWLYTVLESRLFSQSLFFSNPSGSAFTILGSCIAKGLHVCVFSGLSFGPKTTTESEKFLLRNYCQRESVMHFDFNGISHFFFFSSHIKITETSHPWVPACGGFSITCGSLALGFHLDWVLCTVSDFRQWNMWECEVVWVRKTPQFLLLLSF